MGFSSENGYVPASIDAIISAIRVEINTQFGTAYTAESFVGTNHYKYYYSLAQRLQENEVKTSEIFLYLQQYFDVINARIQRPVGTAPGIIEALANEGYIASVKPSIEAEAGEIFICVDTDETDDEYAATKLEICTIIKDSVSAGIVSQGAQVETIVLTNGQAFDFKFALPDRITVLLRLTTTLSENNQVVIDAPEDVKLALLANITARYRLGKNFEPQTYFNTEDAPWTSDVLLEWSDDDGETWNSTVFDAEFDELFDIDLEDITLVEE